nr:2-amino-4-hydroxy-6-hydroxymethyldihydropteridine diphosphokinase [uncultured Porphyromonas sp.]
MAKLYLALGSNQGDRKALLDAARAACDASLGRVTGCSDYIETAPWGFSSPHPFLNAVLELETELSPIAVLELTQEIERQLGRLTKSSAAGYQDRPIDLDLLLYDDLVLETPRLTLPHPLMHLRDFVLEPLQQLAPTLRHPVLGLSIAELYSRLQR